jgi:endonuclease/exonuclease/phosphatase family metal-dependent hydrolase
MDWGKFRDKRTGKVFFCFNSHYDHIGIEARDYSSDILVQAVRDIAQGMPSFLTGDFNSDENTSAYKKILASGFLADSMLALPEAERKNWEYFSMSHYKPISTVKKSYRHIDHVFYTPATSRVGSWQLILDSYDGVFGSDHLPILIEWTIAN